MVGKTDFQGRAGGGAPPAREVGEGLGRADRRRRATRVRALGIDPGAGDDSAATTTMGGGDLLDEATDGSLEEVQNAELGGSLDRMCRPSRARGLGEDRGCAKQDGKGQGRQNSSCAEGGHRIRGSFRTASSQWPARP